ncbi:hypothetical protein C8R47DRAFT_1074062 [Mycena vitilis]|nr:hypothetical protein C8R47DRAFT_1074062 [Mycena vitilis]
MPLAVEHSQCSPGSLANGQQDEVEGSGNQRMRSPINPITGRSRISPGVGHRTQSPIIPVTGLVRMSPDVAFCHDTTRRTTTTLGNDTLLSKHATRQLKNASRGNEVRNPRQASGKAALTWASRNRNTPATTSEETRLATRTRADDFPFTQPLVPATQEQENSSPKLRTTHTKPLKSLKWAVGIGIALFGAYLVSMGGAFLAEWKRDPNPENQMRPLLLGLKAALPDNSPSSFTFEILLERLTANSTRYSLSTTMPIFYRNFVPGAGQHRTSTPPPPRLDPAPAPRNTIRGNDTWRTTTSGPLSAVQTAVLARRRTHYFGRVDARPLGGTIHQRLRAASDAQWASLITDGEVPLRPASLVAPQSNYTGVETRANGQEVHHAVLLNARLLIHNPATGQPGTRNGHAIIHFFAAPLDEHATWDIEAPCGRANGFRQQLSHYGPHVHRELELQRRPGEFMMNVDRSITRVPTPPVPEAQPPRTVYSAAVAPRLAPILETRTNRFLRDPTSACVARVTTRTNPFDSPPPRLGDLHGQDTGLVDAETGHEVVALPTRAHPTLPAVPRPGTPGPQYRLFEQQPRLRAKRASSTEAGDPQVKKARTQFQTDNSPVCVTSNQRMKPSNKRIEQHHQDILKRMVNERLAQAEALIKYVSWLVVNVPTEGALNSQIVSTKEGQTPSDDITTSDIEVDAGTRDPSSSEGEIQSSHSSDDMSIDEALELAFAKIAVDRAANGSADAGMEDVAETREGSVDASSDGEEENEDKPGSRVFGPEIRFCDSPAPVAPHLRTDLSLPDRDLSSWENVSPDSPRLLYTASSSPRSSPASPSAHSASASSEYHSPALSAISDNVPGLDTTLFTNVPLARSRPALFAPTPSYRSSPSVYLGSSGVSSLPSLVSFSPSLSPGAFHFRHQQIETKSYFPSPHTVANDRASPFKPIALRRTRPLPTHRWKRASSIRRFTTCVLFLLLPRWIRMRGQWMSSGFGSCPRNTICSSCTNGIGRIVE